MASAIEQERDALKALVKDIWRGADLPPALARRAWALVMRDDSTSGTYESDPIATQIKACRHCARPYGTPHALGCTANDDNGFGDDERETP